MRTVLREVAATVVVLVQTGAVLLLLFKELPAVHDAGSWTDASGPIYRSLMLLLLVAVDTPFKERK